MHSIYLQATGQRSKELETDVWPGDRRAQVLAVARLTCSWLERIGTLDLRREQVSRLGLMAEDLAAGGSPSPSAIAAIRAMLCGNCRRLGAAPGGCSGQVLERCPLLAKAEIERE